MKKILLLALMISSFGCKNNSEELITLRGSYMFFEDAAVLQASNEIYGVYLNDKAIALNKASKKFKAAPTDVIIAEVKGRVSTEKHEKILWEKKFEIIEIHGFDKATFLSRVLKKLTNNRFYILETRLINSLLISNAVSLKKEIKKCGRIQVRARKK